ncbi:MAG: ATP-binding cassette domain-containing protein [Treponema sp.]|jgi:ABC-2 type transport system ATP-binding protein|nr:ATP-binding cassette domain-containing protein [Treponema sp.]
MHIIKVDNLVKTYTTFKRGSGMKETLQSFFRREKVIINAVDNISFNVEEGAICGVLGPNGAGKSTTIKMLCGALYPSSGKIDVMGYSPSKERKKYVREIGAVFGQRSQLVWDIPPIDSFNMNRAIYGIPQTEYKTRLGELAEMFEIQEVMHKPTRVLSLGERMKCEFIMAMLHKPKIVFLDEPTIGLDVVAKAKIRDFIRQVNQNGTTFILTTHDLEDVKQLARHVIIINHGVKVFDDTLQNLQMNLGGKKIVGLTLEEPYAGGILDNIKIIEQKSPLELTLEVDTSKITISDFMENLSRKVSFSDISVKELPMEEIVMQIYNTHNRA